MAFMKSRNGEGSSGAGSPEHRTSSSSGRLPQETRRTGTARVSQVLDIERVLKVWWVRLQIWSRCAFVAGGGITSQVNCRSGRGHESLRSRTEGRTGTRGLVHYRESVTTSLFDSIAIRLSFICRMAFMPIAHSSAVNPRFRVCRRASASGKILLISPNSPRRSG